MGNAIICDKCRKVVELPEFCWGHVGLLHLRMDINIETSHMETMTLCRQCYAEVCKFVNAKGGPDA